MQVREKVAGSSRSVCLLAWGRTSSERRARAQHRLRPVRDFAGGGRGSPAGAMAADLARGNIMTEAAADDPPEMGGHPPEDWDRPILGRP